MKTFAIMLFVEAESLEEAQKKALHDWPTMLLPLKLLAQPNDTGLGDIIERTIGPLGGEAFKIWYEKTFGRPCGCNTRKEHWNKRYPLK